MLKAKLDKIFFTQKTDYDLIEKLFSIEEDVKNNIIDGVEYVEFQIPINLISNHKSILLSLEGFFFM